MEWLVASTAESLKIGPFVDKSDGVTPETGLAGTMTVYLAKGSAVFAARASVGAITYDRDGFYLVPLSVTDVGGVGRLKLEVTNDAVHLPVWHDYRVITQSEYDEAVGLSGTLYATAALLRSFKVGGATVDLSAYTNDELETEINLASRIIENICNDIFYEKTETNKFDGPGTCRLFFIPKIPYQLLSVTSLKEYDDDRVTVLETYVENEDYRLYPFHVETLKWYPGDSPRRRFGSGGVWPKGQKNIWIEGTWGASETPVEITRAAILLSLERTMPGSTGAVPDGIMQTVWSDFTISYKQASSGEMVGMSTGFNEVDRLLFEYVNRVDMFQVVGAEKHTYDNRLVN